MSNTLALTYLFPEDLEHLWDSFGFSPEAIPSIDKIEAFLRVLEIRIDSWFGCRIAPCEYVQERPSNNNGIIVLANYPVLEVKDVELRWVRVAPKQSPAYTKIDVLWEGGRIIYTPTKGDYYRIKYVAGYDPIPDQIKECLIGLLFRFFTLSPGDFNVGKLLQFTISPRKDLTNVSLPGGIGQTFRVGTLEKTNDGANIGGSELDIALLPLIELRIRRTVIT